MLSRKINKNCKLNENNCIHHFFKSSLLNLKLNINEQTVKTLSLNYDLVGLKKSFKRKPF